jgi:hypothetical protein
MNYITDITAIETMVGEKLANASDITPEELRACFSAVTGFFKKIAPLATGIFTIADITSTDEIRTVNLPYDVGTSNYRVQGSLVSKGANYSNDNDAFEVVKDKTATSFKLCLREISGNIQNLDFEWAIYPKN